MTAINHGPHLTQLAYRRVFNCYVVTDDDGLTLIDTGPKGARSQILELLARMRAPLCRIVLTHAHSDHVAGLDSLVRSCANDVEIICGKREAALLAGDFALLAGEPTTPPKPWTYLSPRTKPTRLVTDGDQIGSLKVVETPGHTPGHLSLVDTRDQTVIAGDAVTTLGRTAVSGDLVWRWPFPALLTWDKPLALQSAKRLLDERPTRLATGHGPVLADSATDLDRAVAAAS